MGLVLYSILWLMQGFISSTVGHSVQVVGSRLQTLLVAGGTACRLGDRSFYCRDDCCCNELPTPTTITVAGSAASPACVQLGHFVTDCTQRTQYPLIQEHTLNHNSKAPIT